MKTNSQTTYQIERAPGQSDSWEQLAPSVSDQHDMRILMADQQIKEHQTSRPARLRIVRTTRTVIR